MLIIIAIGTFVSIILWNENWTSLGLAVATGITCAAYAILRWAMCKIAPYVFRLDLAYAVRLCILFLLLFAVIFWASLYLPF